MNSFRNEKADLPSYSSATSSTAAPIASTSNAAAFESQFASISLHQSDRIRLLHFSVDTIADLRLIIAGCWKLGIQAERMYGGSHEFKLGGYPWMSTSSSFSIPSKVLMGHILAYLYSVGWIMHHSVDLSRKITDKDTMVFRKQLTPPKKSLWFSISFHRSDRLRLIGAENTIIAAFQDLLKEIGYYKSEQRLSDSHEFKLVGYPWQPSGEETMKMRLLILKMLETLERHGWSLYASVDQSDGTEDTGETDSWHLIKDADWVPGNPIFHR